MSIFDNGLEGEYYVHNWGWMVKALKDCIAITKNLEDAFKTFEEKYHIELATNVKKEISELVENGTIDSIVAGIITNQPWKSVKAYGAKGDGVTDDSIAINQCIAENNYIYFPKGTYLYTASHSTEYATDMSHKHFLGDGIQETLIDSKQVFIRAQNCFDISFENMTIQGDDQQWYAGIDLKNCTHIDIKNCEICYFKSANVWLTDCIYTNIEQCECHHSTVSMGINIEFATATQPKHGFNNVTRCKCHHNGLDGILIKNGFANITFNYCIENGQAEGHRAAGIYGNGALHCNVSNNVANSNTGNGIDFIDSNYCTFNNNLTLSNNCAGFLLNGACNLCVVSYHQSEGNGLSPIAGKETPQKWDFMSISTGSIFLFNITTTFANVTKDAGIYLNNKDAFVFNLYAFGDYTQPVINKVANAKLATTVNNPT